MKFKNIFFLPVIILKAIYYWLLTPKNNLPGIEFAKFGRATGFKMFLKNKEFIPLTLAPVSIVRYFEFEYVKKILGSDINNTSILDVSSPYLFAFYICKNNSLTYNYINPDERDTNKIRTISKNITFKSNLLINEIDATKLPFSNNFFENILSISVIEHINFDGDSLAIKEMWRTLKPGGKLILTFPVQKTFEEEYRDQNVYELKSGMKDGKYFFQRYYDNKAIEERLLNKINNFEILNKEVFGEIKKDFFKEYERRWISNGLSETVKDPYYIAKYFKKYNNIEELPGIGVIGITLKKI